MMQSDFDQIIKDLTQDLEGLESIINRLKQRQAYGHNNEHQGKDFDSANTLSAQLADTIKQLENCLLGG